MATDYYKKLPLLLQEEFRDGRWLPIVGAGLSRNAATPAGSTMPDWKTLGDRIAMYLPDGYRDGGPIESISTFQSQFGRQALIDRLSEELMIDVARPGDVHRAFARIAFDTVITTNLDFLLEQSWAETGRPVQPIIGEQQLTARRRKLATQLLKFHGDVHHPNEAIVTEDDYDAFLSTYPVLATFVASLLIRRVPILIGYSLDDPDFRAILHLLVQRLGRNAPAPWVILAKSNPAQIDRFRRRGVRPIILETRAKVSYSEVLTRFFEELAANLPLVAGRKAEGGGDHVLTELRLSETSSRSLVVFIGSNEILGVHRTLLFPAVRAQGLVPLTLDELQTAPGLRLASAEQLIRRAGVVVADTRGSAQARSELEFVQSLDGLETAIIHITDRRGSIGRAPTRIMILHAEEDDGLDARLLRSLVDQIVEVTSARRDVRTDTILERLRVGDTSFAFLEAMLKVEAKLRESAETDATRFTQLLRFNENLSSEEQNLLREAYKMRSEFLHKGVEPPAPRSAALTRAILNIIQRLP